MAAEAKVAKTVKPAKFGPSFAGNFPDEMRRQLWPLCCGASIISGFKAVNLLSDDELIEAINHTVTKAVPDFQVFATEHMRPKMTFLTLNEDQMHSKKIMAAIEKCGFKMIGEGRPRSARQGFFLRDESNSWKSI